jgi:hypothetical protein
MNWGRIPDNDNLFRHCTHPISFKKDRFASEKVIKIYDEPDGKTLLASLAWQRFVPTTELVHGYGCRLSLGINNRANAKGKIDANRRNIYCGAYKLSADTVRALRTDLDEVESADVIHNIEEGEFSHTDVRIVLIPSVGLDRENTKTAIVDRLWYACTGPLRHICDCDMEINPHPSSNLITAPSGAYLDTRSSFYRIWSIIRYRIYVWLWPRITPLLQRLDEITSYSAREASESAGAPRSENGRNG